jgi:hypothetical protein
LGLKVNLKFLEKYLVNGGLEALRISLIQKGYLKVNILVMESL